MSFAFPDQRIVLVGGPGGVGKTTLAASLAVRYAERGLKTIVLTVDPARRLAQALGFSDFSQDLQMVTIPGFPDAVLHATMLDTQRYFDRIVEKFAKSPEQKTKILNNALYRTMVDNLGGTHEYAAMERLLEFANDPRFDRIVVDTPPTQNAVDLLSAPQRLANFMDNRVLKWFRGSSPYYLQIFKTGTKLAMKMMQKIFGAEFLDSLGKFLEDMDGMQEGFQQRNLQVMELLRSPQTAFLLVTYPSEERFGESVSFRDKLQEHKIPLRGLVLNRLETACPADDTLNAKYPEFVDYRQRLARAQQTWVDEFQRAFPSIIIKKLPYQTQPLHDLTSLSQLGESLVELNDETKSPR